MQGYETVTERARRKGVARSTVLRQIWRKRLFAVRPLGDFGPYLVPLDDEGADSSRAIDVDHSTRPEDGQREAQRA